MSSADRDEVGRHRERLGGETHTCSRITSHLVDIGTPRHGRRAASELDARVVVVGLRLCRDDVRVRNWKKDEQRDNQAEHQNVSTGTQGAARPEVRSSPLPLNANHP